MKLATLCYVENREKTLMMHRTGEGKDGKWNALGGKIESGETPEEGIIREVFEESGLEIDKLVLKGLITYPSEYQGESWYVFIFQTSFFNGTLKTQTKEGSLHWIDKSNILELDLWDGDKLLIEWLKTNKFFSGKIVYDKNQKVVSSSVNFY